MISGNILVYADDLNEGVHFISTNGATTGIPTQYCTGYIIKRTNTDGIIVLHNVSDGTTYINSRGGTSWGGWQTIMRNSDLVFGNITSFSIPSNSNIRKTVDLPGYGSNYRVFAYTKGSDWASVTAIYCNNNQAVLDIRNFAGSAVNVSVDYTVIRK